jgi:hypothetical protein
MSQAETLMSLLAQGLESQTQLLAELQTDQDAHRRIMKLHQQTIEAHHQLLKELSNQVIKLKETIELRTQ